MTEISLNFYLLLRIEVSEISNFE